MFIDIHVYTRSHPHPPGPNGEQLASPAEIIERYDRIGVSKGIILPGTNPECAVAVQSNEEVLAICEKYEGRFIPFCNIDPRAVTNSPDAPLDIPLKFYKDAGCRGVGEVAANLPFDHPMMANLFSHCQALALPLTFHLAPGTEGFYGIYDDPGLPLLERALTEFPDLLLLGHSQPFWAEIAPLQPGQNRNGYPTGPVREGGRVPALMRRYPNLHGDLSAGSGHNAICRDPQFGCRFLEEFQDRLYYGTNISASPDHTPLKDFLRDARDRGMVTEACFGKIAHRNAERLLGLG